MGGNALTSGLTRRYCSDEFYLLAEEIVGKLNEDFPNSRCEVLKAYRNKETFGDMDIIIESDNLNINLIEYLKERFRSKEVKQNSNTYSFECNSFQIDLILMSTNNYDTALAYYAWNDLGNFMGRIYHKMGVKYGHEGLSLVFRSDNYQFSEENISKDTRRILEFGGYDADRFFEGFGDLEDIFKFAASTPFFNKSIYAFENRNHTSRVRDRKRMSYNQFVNWVETAPNLPEYPWVNESEIGGRIFPPPFLNRIFEYFPEFEETFENTMEEFERWKNAKTIFNGKMVGTITGLTDKDLGMFMKYLKERGRNMPDFRSWIISQGDVGINQWVKEEFDTWKI